MTKCIIFDVDGVLADACSIHRDCFEMALFQCVGDAARDEAVSARERLEGLPSRVKLQVLGVPFENHLSVLNEKQRLTLEAALQYPRDEGRIQMLASLQSKGIAIRAYTNAVRHTAETFLRSAGLLPYIEHLVTNEDVTKPKPSPEGYFKAMGSFKNGPEGWWSASYTPEECLIVEDSEVGLQAARATGALVLKTTFETLDLR